MDSARHRKLLDQLLRHPPEFHRDGSGRPVSYGIDPGLATHLGTYVKAGMRTLETGSGSSTVVFLLQGAHHTAITVEKAEISRIRQYCKVNGISSAHFSPEIASSTKALPKLSPKAVFDVVLIDGDHAFPVPCLDWYFGVARLKKGGILIVDDIQLWTGKILADFMAEDEGSWQALVRTPRYAIFRLRQPSRALLSRGWTQQNYVVRRSLQADSTDAPPPNSTGLPWWLIREPCRRAWKILTKFK